MTVLRTGRRTRLLGQIDMDAPLYSPPALIGDAFMCPPRTGCTASAATF